MSLTAEGGEEEEAAEAVRCLVVCNVWHQSGLAAPTPRETNRHQQLPGGGGLAAGTGGQRHQEKRARPGRTAARAPPTRAPVGSARGPKPNALPQGQAHGKATVGAKSGRPGSEPARGRGRSGRPGGDIEFARGRWKRRPGDGVATGSGIGDDPRRAAAWRRAAASASRRRAAAAASAPAAASARAISPLARVAPAPASRRARLVLCRPLFSRPWARGPRSARRRSARSAARPLADVVRLGSRRSASSGSGRAGAPGPASRWRRAAAAAFLCASGRAR